jgi:hypothetical protein
VRREVEPTEPPLDLGDQRRDLLLLAHVGAHEEDA